MRYSQDIIEEVRSGNDIVDLIGGYVSLRNRGGNFFGLCPFHNEKSPSFSVSSDKQMYYCFGCGAGGNVISFIMQIENYDFIDSLKFLADRINYILPQPQQNEAAKQQLRKREVLREIHKVAARFYYDTLQEDKSEAKSARKYLDDRQIQLRKAFALGLSPSNWDSLTKNLQKHGFSLSDMVESGLVRNNAAGGYYDRFRGRLMFPILDVDKHVVAFGGRIMGDGEPKYLNSPETPLFDKSRQLYGIHAARKARHKELIIVEGYMDVLSLHQAGFSQAVGVLGTALTTHHTRLIKRINSDTVILLFDRDRAGVQALLRAIPILLEAGIKVKCLQVSEDTKDPDEYLQKYGAAHFRVLLDSAKNHAAFRIELLTKEFDLKNTEQRIIFTQEAAKVLSSIDNAIEADAYIRDTAVLTGIAPQAIRAEMDKHRGARFSQEAAPRELPSLRQSLRGRQNDRGLLEARKGMLSVLFAYPSVNQQLKEFLSPDEIGGGIPAKLLELAYLGEEKNVADIISQFESLEEQQQTAELLKDQPNFENTAAMEKAVNEMWRTIKKSYFIERMSEETDLNVINTLGSALRNLEKQYISLNNGVK